MGSGGNYLHKLTYMSTLCGRNIGLASWKLFNINLAVMKMIKHFHDRNTLIND